MILYERDKSLSLDVIAYEYPNSPRSEKGGFDYDPNWLVAEIRYTENNISYSQKDACLLTSELSDLYETMRSLQELETGSYISDFLEPYLQIAILKIDGQYAFAVHFVYDTEEKWKEWEICSQVSESEYSGFLEELKALVKKFPQK